jgi:hypothetical protein
VPPDALLEFESKLESDLQSVAVTLTAVTGVIIYWRGVWSLLDALLGDSLLGDVCCIVAVRATDVCALPPLALWPACVCTICVVG